MHPIGVVVPGLNEAARIAACLTSVRAQEDGGADADVVVVDGGSGDDTREQAARFARLFHYGDQGIFVRHGVVRQQLRNPVLVAAFLAGAAPSRLARRYENVHR